ITVKTVPVRGQSANTRSGRYHPGVPSAARTSQHVQLTGNRLNRQHTNGREQWFHTTCLVLLQAIFRSGPFSLALRRSRMARFVEVNMGINPRNVRSEGVAPCK